MTVLAGGEETKEGREGSKGRKREGGENVCNHGRGTGGCFFLIHFFNIF